MINFDSNDDQVAEMKLDHFGLGIGISPSSNLHVSGNTIISQSLTIGSSSSSQSNLMLSGTLGVSIETVTSGTNIQDHSVVLADSDSGNIILNLPYAANVQGQFLNIKKTSLNNSVWVIGGGNHIDTNLVLELNSSTSLPYISVVSDGQQWYILDSDESTEIAASNLVGWWGFDQISDNIVQDLSQNSNTGNAINISNLDQSGKFNNAIEFDGIDDYVDMGDVSELNLAGPITICAWINMSQLASISGFDYIIVSNTDSSTTGYQVVIQDDTDTVRAQLRGLTDTFVSGTAPALSSGNWHHVVYSWDGINHHTYQDGVQVLEDDGEGGAPAAPTGRDFTISRQTNSFMGKIDDVRVYDKALTAEEVMAIYLAGQD